MSAYASMTNLYYYFPYVPLSFPSLFLIHLSVHLCVCLSAALSVFLFVYVSLSHVSVSLSRVSASLSHVFVSLSLCLSLSFFLFNTQTLF